MKVKAATYNNDTPTLCELFLKLSPVKHRRQLHQRVQQLHFKRNVLFLQYFIAVVRQASVQLFAFFPGGSPLKFGAPVLGLRCARIYVMSCSAPIGSGPGRLQREQDRRACVRDSGTHKRLHPWAQVSESCTQLLLMLLELM